MNKQYQRRLAVFALSIISFVSTSASAESLSIADREQAVYAAVINHGVNDGISMVVLASNTTGDPAAIGEEENVQLVIGDLEIPRETLTDWQQRNRRISPIEYSLNVDASYQILDRKTHRVLFNNSEPEPGWQAFFERYPNALGLLRVSHAGFDHTLSHALIYAEFHCGAECGSGRLIHLRDDGSNSWAVHESAIVWIVD